MLFIASEDNTRDIGIFPRDMHFSVFEGNVSGDGYDRHITFAGPRSSPINGRCLPMFTQGHDRYPLWLPVDRTYAGQARLVSANMYERIWDDWFFAPSGERYEPEQSIQLPVTGELFPMQQVLAVYKMLRRLKHRDANAFGTLTFVANDVNKSILAPTSVLTGFARRPLALGPEEEIDMPRRRLLSEMLRFDKARQKIWLNKPWHRDE